MGIAVVGGRQLNAAALVVGPRDGAGATLIEMARELDFAQVERYRGIVAAERHAETVPLLFFLCAAVTDVRTLKPTADAVRFSPNPTIRFAPLIYLASNSSAANIRLCIQMGFDDVIALPCAGGDLRQRILRQVEQRRVYYETASYFGPDRRDRASAPRGGAGAGVGEFRRIEIIRRLATGIDVLSGYDQVEV